ncbi:MAG: Rqc2 family fibronectin-binding protein, partial [Eubacteriaceae bacterium]
MPYDGVTTFSVVQELKDKLIHGKINKVYQPETDEIIININNAGLKYNLLLSANNNNPRVYLTENKKENPLSPPMFCMLLRKNIQGGIILNVEQYHFDRIIKFFVKTKNELGDNVVRIIIIEIMGRHSNIIIVKEENNTIIDSVKRISNNISSFREVLPGKIYVNPPQNKLSPIEIDRIHFIDMLNNYNEKKKVHKFLIDNFLGISNPMAHEICHRAQINSDDTLIMLSEKQNEKLYEEFKSIFENLESILIPTMYTNSSKTKLFDFSAIEYTYYELYEKTNYESISFLLEDYYLLRDNLFRIKNKSSQILQLLNNKLERNYNKLTKLLAEFQRAEDANIYKLYGELITSNIYQIKQGQSSINLFNYYDNEYIDISLSKQLSPSENAQKYFKKYNKSKRAKEYLTEQIDITKEEIYYLESQLDNIEKCTTLEEFNEIKEELIENDYVKMTGNYKKKKNTKSLSSPFHFHYNGYDIYVGKNNKQNEYLTLKFASKTDIWLHVKDIPGSHVVIKMDLNSFDESTLHKAALLAAYYSKAKDSSNVPVDYTEVKYVKKPKGAKTGMVIYTNQKTIFVTPDEEAVLSMNVKN